MTAAPLRIALAGAGMVSAFHLRAWRAYSGARVVAIADPHHEAARGRAREFGIDAVYDDAAQMLDREHPDALDIAAGHSAHATLCDLAAARGIATLCQKPLAPTLADATAIARRVEGRMRLMVHENWRFRPWYQAAARLLREDRIGTPRSLALAARSSGLVARNGVLPSLVRQPMLGVLRRLMIAEVLVHHLDVAALLVGDLDVTGARVRHDVPQVRGESAATIELRAQGLQAVVEGDFTRADAPESVTDVMTVEGSAGTLALDGAGLRLRGRTSEDVTFDFAAGYQRSYDGAIAHFADALRDDTPFATPVSAHLRVLQQMEDAYRIARRA